MAKGTRKSLVFYRKRRTVKGGGNTLNRKIPSDAVIANPLNVAEYHGDNAV